MSQKIELNSNHTIIPQISVRLSFDFHGNRSHDALRVRPMSCSEPDDVPFLLEFVRIWSIIQLNDFVWCSLAFIVVVADGVARTIYPAINRAFTVQPKKVH